MSKHKTTIKFREAKVNRDTGVISNVHLMGIQSTNKVGDNPPYKYEEAALAGAVGKYNNKPIYLNHDYFRSVEAKIGVTLADVQFQAGKGLVGSIHLNKEHPLAATILWWAEHHPDHIGMSHVAGVTYNEETNSVTQIEEVESIDLVYQGATTKGLFTESDDARIKVKHLIEQLIVLTDERVLQPLNKDIDCKESAIKYAAALYETVHKLTNQPKETTMEPKDITLEMLNKDRADLVKSIREAAIQEHRALEAKVQEAIKDIDPKHQTKVFVSQIREALQAGKDASDLVADRMALTEAVKSNGQAKDQSTQGGAKQPVAIGSVDDLLKNFN